MQQRTQAWIRLVRNVRMPVDAGIAETDRLAVFLDVGDDEDLGMLRQLELMQHVDFERAETAAELHVFGGRDLLVAEDDDVVIEMGPMDAGEIGVVDRLRDVEADDFSADGGGERADFEVLGWGAGSLRGKDGRHGKQ